jgi:hypothetical protein
LKKTFTISRHDLSTQSTSTLEMQITNTTGSEKETASILRSLERLGRDPSILSYEMSLEVRAARYGGIATNAWRVRADRGRKPEVEAPLEV